MRNVATVVLSSVVAFTALDVAAGPTVTIEAPDVDVDATKSARKAIEGTSPKLKAALARDRRVSGLAEQIAQVAKIKDRRLRAQRMQALVPQIRAVREATLKAASVPESELARGTAARSTSFNAPTVSKPLAGSLISSTTVTSFPTPYSFKDQCPDDGDKWDFDGNKVAVYAKSTPTDKDCWIIKAGRTGTVQVPKGTRRVDVLFEGKVDLDVFAMSFLVYAKATGYWGIRAWAPSGATLSTITLPNGAKQPIPGAVCKLKSISAVNKAPESAIVPFDTDGFESDLQEGDGGNVCSFDVPANLGASLELTPFTGGLVDADLSGVSIANHLIEPRKLKVSFYR